jgi:hypothetical protein
MNDPIPKAVPPSEPSGFDSPNCVDLVYDILEWDSTVRPLRPSLLKLALAERERLARLQAQQGAT